MAYPFSDWSRKSDSELRSIVATFSCEGRYGRYVRLAKTELDRRGVCYADCISPEEL